MEENIKYKDILGLIYEAEEKTLEEKMKQANKSVKEKIQDINTKKLLEDTAKPKELLRSFEKIEENYSVKIAAYNKEFYKQGFIDGVNLIINCFKT